MYASPCYLLRSAGTLISVSFKFLAMLLIGLFPLYFCSEKYLELLIVTLQRLAPDNLNIDSSIREVLEGSRNSFNKRHEDKKLPVDGINAGVAVDPPQALTAQLMYWWQMVMTFILLSFAASCISQFAQHYQLGKDMEELGKLKNRLMLQQMIGDQVSGSDLKMRHNVRTQHPFIHRPSSPMPENWQSAQSPSSPWSLLVPNHEGQALSPVTFSYSPAPNSPVPSRGVYLAANGKLKITPVRGLRQ
jgi:hypothetical protein